MGISGDQAKSCKETWKAVAPNAQKHGNEIFAKFLAANPGEKPRFKKFASVADGDLKGNSDFQKQALAVVTALGNYINVVDNAGGLKSATSAMAAQHKAMNVCKPEFAKMFPIIIDYIVANAGGDKGAWQACLDTIGEAITSQQ